MSISPRICPLRLLDQNLDLHMDPQDLIFPYYDYYRRNYFTPGISRDIPKDTESTVKEDQDRLTICIDVQHFKHNELDVKVNDKDIVIEGIHDERQDEHGFISRKFSRRYMLPKNCPPENVSSTLSFDGMLTVTATKTVREDSCQEKIVPIKFCRPCLYKEQLSTKSANNPKDIVSTRIEDNVDNSTSKVMLKDHSCLLKPKLMDGSVGPKEKITDKTKQMDDLFKTSEKLTQESSRIASEIIDEAFGQTSKSKGELETFGECSMQGTDEKSSSKSKDFSEFQETFQSSSKSHEARITEIKSEFHNDVISAELKEAADNI